MVKCLFKLPIPVLQSHLGALKTFFFLNWKSRNCELKVYVKVPKKAKRERNLTWQVKGCCLVRELYKVISVLFYLLLGLRNSGAIGKKTVDRVTITECKQVTDGMTCVE